ncbi:MAG: aspartyl/asparaginyl beta-hydroxylase domain-containing protein [Rhizomicrobium sp.]
MKLPERLIELFDYPVGDIAAAMPDAASPLWDVNPYRQTKHAVHSQTRSIIFEWISDSWQPGQEAIVLHSDPAPPALTRAAYACAETLNRRYNGQIIRLLLAELKPRAKVAPHKDRGPGVVLVHRLHVPVVSNPGVKFFIDDVAHYLEPGIAYEFDNTRRHAVDNDSDSPRIHLMCDILPAELVV